MARPRKPSRTKIDFRELVARIRLRIERSRGVPVPIAAMASVAGVGRATFFRMLAGTHQTHTRLVRRVAKGFAVAIAEVEEALHVTRMSRATAGSQVRKRR